MTKHGDTRVPALDPLGLRALLGEVTERVEGVALLADRMQGLLQAVVSIGSRLDVAAVLHEIVTTAATVANAEYAALGVLDPTAERRLSQFITVGMDDGQRAMIGDLPHGHGVLGLLIDDPRTIRLTDIAAHPSSYGFPAEHPPMHTFLGVPIVVHGEVFGNLYLTEKRGGDDFGPADEALVQILATAAGLAIQNARLYEQAGQREQWLGVSRDITAMLLGGSPPEEVFPTLIACARELAGADSAFLALPAGDGSLSADFADGAGADKILGMVLPKESMSARVLSDGHPVAVADASTDRQVWQRVIEAAGAGPALFVPLGTEQAAVGTLVVTRVLDRASFSKDTIALIESLAGQAALALRLGNAARDREQLAILGDRDRIARDLHDLVIQRLFATGMSLEGSLRRLSPPAADRIRQAVTDLDDTIREIRSTIFALQSPAPLTGDGLRRAVSHALVSASRALGFEPVARIDGPIDTVVPQHVGEQLLAVLREALSNVTRHAKATTVSVDIAVAPEHITLDVQDDGIGLPPAGRRSGLTNLERRAIDLGGSFSAEVVPPPGKGTRIRWRVPF
jgi:signal transduction histidine kinase